MAAAIVQFLTGASDSVPTASASSTVFEIPLSDLKKVEKKKPHRAERRKSREYKNRGKSGAEKAASPATAAIPDAAGKPEEAAKANDPVAPEASAAPTVMPAQQLSAPVVAKEPETEPKPQTVEASTPPVPAQPDNSTTQAVQAPSEPAPAKTAEKIIPPIPVIEDISRISHEPYSYLVAGKLTTLMAVAISKNNVRSMHCRFRAKENGPYAEVEMSLVPGSKFTYSAVIPALIPGSAFLYYEFVLTEDQGKKVRSKEFNIPINATVVVPGWQHELTGNRLNVLLENPAQPFEGFIGISSETRK